jgi:POT family proton-dependent oligopeptide transporter
MTEASRLPSDKQSAAQDLAGVPSAPAVASGPSLPDGAPGPEASSALHRRERGHPPGLFLLFLVEMWERFSYYGMRAILVLYLIHSVSDPQNPGRGWTEGRANYLYGWYVGLAYLAPIVGGWLADRFLGTHRSMVVGSLLITLGHLVLGLSGVGELASSDLGLSVFVGGLALIVLGTGYFKPCVSVMVGQLYAPDDPRRDGAFTIFYMGINLGAGLCPLVCGTLGEKVGWHWGFGAAAVGMTAGLLTYLLGRPRYLAGIGAPPAGASALWPPLLFGLSLAGAVGFAWLYHHYDLSRIEEVLGNQVVLSALGLGVSLLIIAFLAWQRPGERGPVASIFLFMLFNAVFWIAFEQAGSTLNVFTERCTQRQLFGWEIPASWFQSINAWEILLLAPVFAALWTALGRRGLDPVQPIKIALGLLFVGLGYVFAVAAARLFDTTGMKVSMFWLVALYTLHTIGELCLSPTGLAYVTKAAPRRFLSLLMGVWFISSFLAGYLGGKIGSQVERVRSGEISLPWHLSPQADYFMLFFVGSLGAGLLVLLLTPLLKRLMPPGVR